MLWNCLADSAEVSDDLLSWFLNQAKSKDHHAMSLETFKHLFMEKVRTHSQIFKWEPLLFALEKKTKYLTSERTSEFIHL